MGLENNAKSGILRMNLRYMTKEFESSASHHPRSQNIHGQSGCLTSEGGVCTACCHFFEVKPLAKPEQRPCRHQNRCGCAIHNQPAQPAVCQTYHCSRETEVLTDPLIRDPVINRMALKRILGLIEAAQVLTQIGAEESARLTANWLSRMPIDLPEE